MSDLSSSFDCVLQAATAAGLDAALLLDRDGRVVAQVGEFSAIELGAIEGVVLRGLKGARLVRDLLAGQAFTFDLDGRKVSILVAARCVFSVGVYKPDANETAERVMQTMRDEAASVVHRLMAHTPMPPLPGGDDGSSSGPATLELVELGVTAGVGGRGGAKA
jgi:hypothetical protein